MNFSKTIILARVSTKEQEDGHSIDAQIQRLEDYCNKKNLDVIRVFRIIESSTRGDRPQFKEMIEFIKVSKERLTLVCDAVDRLQRSIKELPLIEELRSSEKLIIHFLREGQILDDKANSSQLLTYHLFVLMANNYVNAISDNVKRSVQKKLNEGSILGKAPIGYVNIEDDHGNKNVVFDPYKSHLVKKIFEDYATGLHSMKSLRNKTVEWGLKNNTKLEKNLSKSQIEYILKNPFYYGYMRIKSGQLYPHKYESLITRELFFKCEQVRTKSSHVHIKQWNNSGKEDFIFRGLIKCQHCEGLYTPEKKKGKYVYLRPSGHTECEHCKYVREEMVLEQIKNTLKSMTFPKDVLESIKDTLKASLNSKRDFQKQMVKNLNKELSQTQERLDKLAYLLLDGSITKDEHTKIGTELRVKQENLQNKIIAHQKGDETFHITLSTLFELASRSYELFESSNNEQKKKIIKLLYSNLLLSGSNLVAELNKPFDAFIKMGQNKEWLPDQDSNLGPGD